MSHPEVRVAVLEDQRLTLESLEWLLTHSGWSVVVASGDPLQFLAAIKEAKPSLALVDLYLGGAGGGAGAPSTGGQVSGLEVIQTLHAEHPEIGVIALSGNASEGELAAAQAAGAGAALDKNSIGPDQLMAAVRDALRARGGEEGMASSDVGRLTMRELQVLRHLATGADNLKIAALLGITERTVRAHVSALYRKLECENRTEMAVLARSLGIRFSELER